MLPLRALLVVLVLAASMCVQAQQHVPGTFNLEREQVVSLDDGWRFHPVDDPRWADLAFDDSHWPVLHGKGGLVGSRLPLGLSGFGWYRARLVGPAGAPIFPFLLKRSPPVERVIRKAFLLYTLNGMSLVVDMFYELVRSHVGVVLPS